MRIKKYKDDEIVATKKEVLRLLGIKMLTLTSLENQARIRPRANRIGYTTRELQLLRNSLKKIINAEVQ